MPQPVGIPYKTLTCSETLYLKPLTLEDAPSFLKCTQDNLDHLQSYLPGSADIENISLAWKVMEKAESERSSRHGFHCGLWLEGEFIGYAGLYRIQPDGTWGCMGYWLDAQYTGKGYATKACATLVEFAFQELQVERLEVHTAVDNQKSAGVPERLGFQWTRHEEKAENIKGLDITHSIYMLTRESWISTH